VGQKTSSARVGLIPAQRHAEILQILQADGAASVQQLADRMGASVSTIRRDLEVLDEAGFLDRSFGGASLRARALATLETGQAVAEHILHREKEAIGIAAANLVEPHQAVILDSGSTTVEVARAIARRSLPLTVITNDLVVAQTLSGSDRVRLLVTGGIVRPGSSTLLGSPGEDLLGTVRADLAIIGAHAVTPEGISETNLDVVRVKQSIMRAARKLAVVADHSKFGEPSLFRVGPMAAGSTLVTDWRADPDVMGRFGEIGISVLIAPEAAT
jgi:DeoR family transcriptional regulator of aga operon